MKKQKILAMLLSAALLGTSLPAGLVHAEALPSAEETEEELLEVSKEASEEEVAEEDAAETEAEEAAQEAIEESEEKAVEKSEEEAVEESEEEAVEESAEEATVAEENAEAEAVLPQPGDIVNGFTVTDIRDFPLMDAVIVQFVHERTGAELYYIANDDTNRLFDLTFFTKAHDNTGLPHVFEHSTLDGSVKYPSKSLFFNLGYQTYHTYMNAVTYPLMTTYPVASLSEKQLLKLADFYTDSCLNPMIMTDESIYREEAWRYRLMDKDADLTLEGTVYSEMLGAVTLHRMANVNLYKTIFPGSFIVNDTGGLPEYIPDMTYESLREYHNKYYTPSNCAAYLYGQFEHYEDFLALLDEAFAPFEKTEIQDTDDFYTPVNEPVTAEYPFPVEQGIDTKNGSDIYYAMICPDTSKEDMLVLDNLLTLLLSDDASLLIQKLKQVLPSGTFKAYLDMSGPENAFVFMAQNVERESAGIFKDIVDSVMKDLAEKGFAADYVKGVAASQRLSNALSRESASVGVDEVLPMFAYNYSITGNPWYYLECLDTIDHVEEFQAEGFIQDVISRYFVSPERTALCTTYPQPGLKETQDAALAQKLAQVKASMSEEEIDALVETSNAVQPEEDASQYIASLSAVSTDSLPEEITSYPISDETGDDGIRRLSVSAPLDGVSYGAIGINTGSIAQEDLHWYSLYSELYSRLDTKEHTREELASLIKRYLYSFKIYATAQDNYIDKTYSPYLNIFWIALDEDLEEGYDLVYELLYDLKIDDVQLLSDAVTSIRTTLKNEITNTPFNLQVFRGFARNSGMYRYINYLHYLDYYEFLGNVETMLQENPDQVAAMLESIKTQLHNSCKAFTITIGNEESNALRTASSSDFLERLDKEEKEAAVYDLPIPAASEAIILDSSVQYNGYVTDYPSIGYEKFTGDMDGVTALVLDTYLYPMLRDAYGVYGILHAAAVNYGTYLVTYRDPNLTESYDVIASLGDLIEQQEITQDTLDGYILSTYSNYALSPGVLTTASSNLDRYLSGLSEDSKISWMRELKALTPEKLRSYAGAYRDMIQNGYKTTAGGAGMINAHADEFEVILNPFGAVDNTGVEFADLPEDSEYYEAARFIFENGMMDPVSADTFGVDDQATAGDLAGGLFVMMGGYPHAPEDAIAALAPAGLFPADLAADTPLTQEMADGVINALLAAVGVPAPETEETEESDPAAAVTRGDLALALYALATME